MDHGDCDMRLKFFRQRNTCGVVRMLTRNDRWIMETVDMRLKFIRRQNTFGVAPRLLSSIC